MPGRTARGWLLLGLALAGIVVLAGVDRRLKTPPHGGFCPEDALAVAEAPQWPAFWSGAAASDAGRAAAEPAQKLGHAASLAILKQTGVRPTPSRWRLWLGPTLVAG